MLVQPSQTFDSNFKLEGRGLRGDCWTVYVITVPALGSKEFERHNVEGSLVRVPGSCSLFSTTTIRDELSHHLTAFAITPVL